MKIDFQLTILWPDEQGTKSVLPSAEDDGWELAI